MRWIALTGAALLAALIAVLWLARGPDQSDAAEPGDIAPEPATTPVSEKFRTPAALPGTDDRRGEYPGSQVDLPATVASWQGVDPDGRIAFDDQDRLIVDLALRQRFDFLLTGLGEASLASLREELLSQAQLDAGQDARLLAEFDLYVDYLQAADKLVTASAGDLASRFAALVQLQRDLLGPERAESWFGDENAYLQRTLGVLSGQIEAGHPELDPWAGDIQSATAHHLAIEMAGQYEQLNSDPGLRWSEREALYGSDAARRLAELDQQRSGWNDRVQAYRSERERLIADAQTTERIEQALQEWLDSRFDAAEQRRIRALEQAGLLDGSP